MSIEGNGVVTEVSREYETDATELKDFSDQTIAKLESPTLDSVTKAVASAAAIAHNLNV
ncbi:hypothetical protein SEA_ROBINROSE_66 [Microbacterium phage RobinRose]|nr:hypothetical protein SEA_ROBINROSE_66 [Microbacterium phage RobinRose]